MRIAEDFDASLPDEILESFEGKERGASPAGRRPPPNLSQHAPMRPVEARYEEGVLRPDEPLPLRPGERVRLIIVRRPGPDRWDLERLAKSGREEDLALAEQGLEQWAATLDEELDRRVSNTTLNR